MKFCAFDGARQLSLLAYVMGVLMLSSLRLDAQSMVASQEPAQSWFVGMSFGMGSFAVSALPTLCDDYIGETNISVHGGVRVRRSLHIEGIVTGHMELGTNCTRVVISESPDGYTVVTFRGVPRYPYGSSVLRAVLEPGAENAVIRPRLLLGGGWMWGAPVPYLTAGTGFTMGSARTRFVLDFVGHWFDSDYDVVEETWGRPSGGGQMIVLGETSSRSTVRESGFMLRAGFQHFLGSRN